VNFSEQPATERWQELQARWRAILGLEATIDTLRLTMESLRAELETSSKKPLKTEDKVNALNADVAQWNKAKSRAHYALPKAREFIHRATWATGTPERKKLEEVFTNDIPPDLPATKMDQLPEQLEYLLKDRQVLSAQGVTVMQECKSISAQLEGALRTLQKNATANAQRKRREFGKKGKFV
jgi:chromosome segregation ATPase